MRGEPYDAEHRIVVAGEVRSLRERAVLEVDLGGRPVAGLLIRDLPNNRDNQIFVKAMVDVARGQKLSVAECIEDAATLDVVRSLGVTLVQGYYLDRLVADHPALEGCTSIMESDLCRPFAPNLSRVVGTC